MSDMSPDDFSAIATPIIQNIARFADQVRPNKCDGVVGGVVATLHEMAQARDLDDDQRIARLEAEVVSLATLIYRDHQTEFEQFVSESAELVVLDAMIKMLNQPSINDQEEDDLHFGGCPVCRKPGCYLNIHKDHWFLCDEHKTC